jgi:hypothetical protein
MLPGVFLEHEQGLAHRPPDEGVTEGDEVGPEKGQDDQGQLFRVAHFSSSLTMNI